MKNRQVARLILMNEQERFLLLHIYGRNAEYPEHIHFWIVPGGGLEAGETYKQALIREAREEIGLHLRQIGPWVWTETFVIQFETVTVHFDVQYNFIRVQEHAVDLSGMEANEWDSLRGYHWWSLAEMRATDDLLLPRGLPNLVQPIIVGEIPAEPIVLQSHD